MTVNEKIRGIKKLIGLVFINDTMNDDEKKLIIESLDSIIDRIRSSSKN